MTEEARSGARSLIGAAVATLVMFSLLTALGVWQLERKAWKEGLIAAIASRAYGDPGDIPSKQEWAGWNAAEGEFRRVRLAGVFLQDREIELHGLAESPSGQALIGYYVFTPLQLEDGSSVIVNRGFVPLDRKDPATRADSNVAGPVVVTGLVRAPERHGWFLPKNDPVRAEWFVRDVSEMARADRLDRPAPFYVDADATPNPGGWPRGGQTRIVLPNDHLGYAMTWFGLAAALVGVFAAFCWRKLRPESGSASPWPA